MNVATASPDKWAGQGISDMGHSKEYCYVGKNWHHIRQTVQLAKHALVHETLAGSQVAVVANVMCTIITIGLSGIAFRLQVVVVEGNGKRHWQIHQYQQPGKPHSSLVRIAHSPYLLFGVTGGGMTFQDSLELATCNKRKVSIVFRNCHHVPHEARAFLAIFHISHDTMVSSLAHGKTFLLKP